MNWALTVPSAILAAGVVDDLRSRKVHNPLVLICAAVALCHSFYFGGVEGLKDGGLGLLAALATTLPLVLLGVLGAGDLKLFMAFGLALNWEAVLFVALSALIWGAVLGLFKVILSGNFKDLMKNLLFLFSFKKAPAPSTLHKVPYTVAFFMGWITFVINSGGLL